MKKIYIVLTHTGTILSKIVRFYTRKKYSHVSIGLDLNLNELYSFGRLNPNNPYKGGFVKEEINKGIFAKFKNTDGAVYSVTITEEQYNTIKEEIEKFKIEKNKYKFNILGLFLVCIRIKYQRKNHFYCAEFVKYLLEKAFNKKLLPEIITPMDFLKLENTNLIYEGKINNYNIENKMKIAV